MSEGRHQFEHVRKQRGKAIAAHQLKSVDVREVEMLCDKITMEPSHGIKDQFALFVCGNRGVSIFHKAYSGVRT